MNVGRDVNRLPQYRDAPPDHPDSNYAMADRALDARALANAYAPALTNNTTGLSSDLLASFAFHFSLGPLDFTLCFANGAFALFEAGQQTQLQEAIVSPEGKLIKSFPPKVQAKVPVKKDYLAFIDNALKGVSRTGTMSWRLIDFPLDEVKIRSKTGSAEVYGKQSTSWVASYTKDYVVVMMVSQGGTGSGTSGPAVRKIWETLYGVKGTRVRPEAAAIPGTKPPRGLPVFAPDGEILPPRVPTPTRDRGKRS